MEQKSPKDESSPKGQESYQRRMWKNFQGKTKPWLSPKLGRICAPPRRPPLAETSGPRGATRSPAPARTDGACSIPWAQPPGPRGASPSWRRTGARHSTCPS
ncbi:putative multiple C2 and transmembrane domain-containing protein 1-like [Scophthalmus maximus]|uniref:Putative multiple C2 and transmembrane domain-containing protein 1-like n=1 Tax=Scophthalmus maximus TaxID=52904 RepID=A0A2U9BTK3_SCOMX|nr:putative multiple C2 and transmembrane domain-containing protein 1-like [Scophthalmus maximus]